MRIDKKKLAVGLIAFTTALLIPAALKGAVTLPYTFSSGGTIRSAEVNANDQALRDGINNHETDRRIHHTRLQDVLLDGNATNGTNIDFDNAQAVEMRAENLSADPSPGNAGRVFFNTSSKILKVDDGTTILNLGGAAGSVSRSSVASGSANHVVINDGTGALSSEAQLAISRGGTGAATATAGFNALDPLTTKGDLVCHNGTDSIRLGVGANDQLLIADSTQACGVKWGLLPAGGITGTADHVAIFSGGGTLSSEAQLSPSRGGSGVNNTGTLTWGANNVAFTTSGATSLTLPTSGTVATLTGTETLSNKTLAGVTISGLPNAGAVIANGAGVISSEAQLATSRGGTGVNSIAVFPASGTVVTRDATETLINKTISGATNTFVNIPAGTALTGQVPAANGGTGANLSAATGVVKVSSGTFTAAAVGLGGSDVSGTLPIANGGTGQTSANAALNALLPTQTSNAAKYLKTDGTNTSWASVTGGGGFDATNQATDGDAEGNDSSGFTSDLTGGASFSVTNTAGEVFDGTYSYKFDAAQNGNYVQRCYAVPDAIKGRNSLLYFVYKGFDTNYTVAATDGSNTLNSQALSASTIWQPVELTFTGPTSGNICMKLSASANAAVGEFEFYIGKNFKLGTVSQARLYGGVLWNAATNCSWSRTGAGSDSYGAFSADADCTTPTGSNVFGSASAPSTKIPAIKFTTLPPGEYIVTAYGNFNKGTATDSASYFQFHDGTSYATGMNVIYSGTETPVAPMVKGRFSYSTAQSNVTIEVRCKNDNISSSCGVGAAGSDFTILVEYFPSQAETAFRPDQVAWRVDANISGANPDLGTADQSSFVGIEHGSLTLTNNTGAGVISAQIPCSSTNAPSGTTCSVGNESVGVSFNLPVAGDVRACASFAHVMSNGAGGSINTTFQIVETPTNAQTISQEGKSRVYDAQQIASTTLVMPHQVCGTFSFSSAGQKVLRLMYEQDVTATVSLNTLAGDASATVGQRDIHWEVYPLNQQVPAPLLVGSVVNGSSGIDYHGFAQVTSTCSASPCTIAQKSDWISSITWSATGTYQLNATAGYCSTNLVCTGNVFDGSVVVRPVSAGLSTTAFPFKTQISSTGADTNAAFNLSCWCKR